jgi:hypothetical protein
MWGWENHGDDGIGIIPQEGCIIAGQCELTAETWEDAEGQTKKRGGIKNLKDRSFRSFFNAPRPQTIRHAAYRRAVLIDIQSCNGLLTVPVHPQQI